MSARVVIEHVNPPIPLREWDFCAHFDGEEESGMRGQGATAQAAIDDLKDNLDAWECCGCGGAGKREVYHDVTHQLGTDSLPFIDACDECGGVGHCGPDAERRKAVIKAKAGSAQ